MAESDGWDTADFEPEELASQTPAVDLWKGEDVEEDVKHGWLYFSEMLIAEIKTTEKKKLSDKIKAREEKEKQQRKKEEELKNSLREGEKQQELSTEEQLAEKLRLMKLQEKADLEVAKDTFGLNSIGQPAIDSMSPISREDFTEFGRLLKEKITQYEKSEHYIDFLETLLQGISLSLEVDDLKKLNNSLTSLCSEKQKQEKQNKGKKKKKTPVLAGGFKANLKDDLDDYGGYTPEYEDFM
uniref:Eukaryotic translation initiation factor 3, subunit Jb n=1 Tax=Callorhinchus milii TaxID=7868 RepID=A0A4W3K0G4_CALMI